MTKRIVVDASVALKWILAETHSDSAARLLGDEYSVLAPELILHEAAHVLLKRVRARELDDGDAIASLRHLESHVERPTSSESAIRALALAIEFQISAYDATYVALALDEECLFVTADRRLLNALASAFPEIMLWVEDVPGPDES